ncbi:MAG: signal transduction histidine kinase [halophilic archaeon J07HX64]|jgi:Signal transduction histidine kinase|nr:MAG: signal transduction histidine kinase [halophilic archaeon J07HX64]
MREYNVATGGLVVAAVGFVLTRFTVTAAATETTSAFLVAGLLPLVLGLGLSAAGVFLAVGNHDETFVRTVARWCLVGTVGMGGLVAVTLLGSGVDLTDTAAVRDRVSLSTFLIGGAVGGALIGVYAGRNRCYRRDVRERANRLVVLNRLLRDRVVNSATAIRAHADLLARDGDENSADVVAARADDIVETVDQVGHLAETGDESTPQVDLVAGVERALSTVRATHPDAEFTLDAPAQLHVQAGDQLGAVVGHLLGNAAEHSNSDQPQVTVAVEAVGQRAVLRVRDDGPGLPESQRTLLEQGEIAEYDDPTTGFGLNIVRLFAERFDGHLQTEVDDGGTTVELSVPRAVDGDRGPQTVTAPALDTSRGVVAAGAALVAGLVMAGAMAGLDGDLLAIGALYGIEEPVVALVTHEFHSVVFGLVYAAVLGVAGATRGVDRLGSVSLRASHCGCSPRDFSCLSGSNWSVSAPSSRCSRSPRLRVTSPGERPSRSVITSVNGCSLTRGCSQARGRARTGVGPAHDGVT